METFKMLHGYAHKKPGIRRADFASDSYCDIARRMAKHQLYTFHKLYRFVESYNFGGSFEYEGASNEFANMELKRIIENREVSGLQFLTNGTVHYLAFQYWPTEYRRACSQAMAKVIIAILRKEGSKDTHSSFYVLFGNDALLDLGL